MRTFTMASVLLCTMAIGGGIMALRPDPAVKFEAELSRLEPEEALKALREADDRIDFHDNLELMFGRLLLGDGDLGGARRSFQKLLSRAGPSEEVLETLAGIAVVEGDMPSAALYLGQAQEAFPTAERRARLAAWYQSLGMTQSERVLLSRVKPTSLPPPEFERLALLLIEGGRIDEYQALLAAMANHDGEDSLPFKRRLLQFLVEEGRPREAGGIAAGWVGGDGGGAALEESVRALIGRGAIDAAILLAREGFGLAPDESHRVLPVFARSGHGGIARILQAEWLASRDRLTDADWETLTRMAEATGDLRALHGALASRGLQANPGAIAPALMQFLRYRGPVALVPHRALLDEDVFQQAPLVGAAWARWTGDQRGTYRHLVAAATRPLGEWDQMIWMSLLEGLRGTPFHRALLAGAAENPDLRHRLRESVVPLRPVSVLEAASPERPG